MKFARLTIAIGTTILSLSLAGCTAARSANGSLLPDNLQPETSGPGNLTFGGPTINLAQSGGSATFAVNRSGGSTGAVTVHYATQNGTAIAGTDYQAVSGTLSWADGDATVKNITFNDEITAPFTGSKTMAINLSSPTGGATLGTNPTRTVTMSNQFPAPSSLFNFSPYKISLPIDIYRSSGGTGGLQYAAQEVSGAVLNAGFADSYFFLSGLAVVFVATSDGAVVSPGLSSNHTRSELRELYTGTGHDSNDDWTSSISGTLTAQCVVEDVSVDSDEATIGQIHGQSNPFALLIYEPATDDIDLVVYNSNGSSTATYYTVATGVAIGDTINYSLSYSGTTVTAVVNGHTTNATADSSWTGTPVYFKLGAYHAAPNTGNPSGDKTEVKFYSFGITH